MPDLFREWQQPSEDSADAIVRQYERGFAGALYSREENERLASMMTYGSADDVCHAFGFADSSKGKLVATWRGVMETYPGCWPARAQQRGSCVAHSLRNAMLTTLVGEVLAGLPDPVTGRVEEAPEVAPEAQRDGVLAIEPSYHYRGHRGDGWHCSASVRTAIERTGAVLRKDYGFVDLTTLNSRYAGRYHNGPDAETRDAFDDNRFSDSTKVTSFESLRDLLDRGIGVTTCGSEGWAKTRDENGFSRRQGSWAHAMAIVGADDRPEIHRRYGGPLVCILNSWGPSWNRGSRQVMGTELKIPKGAFWARWRDCARRDIYAIGGLRGWERKQLPDLDGGWT